MTLDKLLKVKLIKFIQKRTHPNVNRKKVRERRMSEQILNCAGEANKNIYL